MQTAYIISAQRTPVGGFMGKLSELSAVELGTHAAKAAIEKSRLDAQHIDAVYLGHVLTAGLGQNTARQVAIHTGLRTEADSTTINKVCASGMKAVMLAAQQIELGLEQVLLAGGMESMSNAPHVLSMRRSHKFGDAVLTDTVKHDGLTDAYSALHMGAIAENCVKKYGLSREQQDAFALESYRRAAEATAAGKFAGEIVPVQLKHETLTADEDISKVIPAKVPQLKPAFLPDGTITAANASNLNDGAAMLVLASAQTVRTQKLQPVARIVSSADAALAPEWFTMAPAAAMQKALQRAGLTVNDIDLFEINEAYAAVALANSIELKIPHEKLNIYGGAVAIGHPIGASGARIVCTLLSALRQEKKKFGMAAICNGGGGASAIIIENLL
jgi:acetyl-CoA C-acetyltransferase